MGEKALRYNEGKVNWSLVDFKALEPMVRVLVYGAKKYSPDNWKKGLGTKEICESLMRHLFAYLEGQDIDPESGEAHLGHILCNSMFLSYMMSNKPEFDNRSKKEVKVSDGSFQRVVESEDGFPDISLDRQLRNVTRLYNDDAELGAAVRRYVHMSVTTQLERLERGRYE